MRTLMKVQMAVERGNQALQSGRMPELMNGFMQETKPEAAYFYTENGRRTALWIFDLKDSAQMPNLAERFFSELHAEVTFSPVMNIEDLKKGLQSLQAAHAVR